VGAHLRTALVGACIAALTVAAPPANAAFPGANGKIAFTDGTNLYVINPDGIGRHQVPLPGNCGKEKISWSADGSTLASNTCGGDLLEVRPDGSGYRELRATGSAFLGSWSPDSNKLVYTGFCLSPNACVDVYSINADGTGDTQLTHTGNSCCPLWSPSGNRIAFLQHQSGSLPTGIYTMTPDGALPAKVPNTGPFDIADSWSPDGTRLAFSRYYLNGAHDIYIINVDGSGLTQLTSDGLSSEVAWSPDGTSLVFFSTRDGSANLYLMSADGTNQAMIPNTFPGLHPDWQPIPGPQRSDYKNAAQFCKAERAFLGGTAFANKYTLKGNPANAFGKCVSRNH
jgi:Tol biopolymer transport system component